MMLLWLNSLLNESKEDKTPLGRLRDRLERLRPEKMLERKLEQKT